MTIQQRKDYLISIIDQINDERIIQLIEELITKMNYTTRLNESEKSEIDRGFNSIVNEPTLSHDELITHLQDKFPDLF